MKHCKTAQNFGNLQGINCIHSRVGRSNQRPEVDVIGGTWQQEPFLSAPTRDKNTPKNAAQSLEFKPDEKCIEMRKNKKSRVLPWDTMLVDRANGVVLGA